MVPGRDVQALKRLWRRTGSSAACRDPSQEVIPRGSQKMPWTICWYKRAVVLVKPRGVKKVWTPRRLGFVYN